MIEQKEKDRISEEVVNKMMKKQEDMYKVLLEKQEDKYKVALEKQENMYKALLETIEQKEKDRITREEIWRNLETERIRKETEQMEKDRITREETWRNLENERMGKEEERRAEDSRRSLAVLSLVGKFLGQQVIDNAGPLGQQEINTPQSIEQQKINVPQSSEIISHDQSGQKKQMFHNWTKHEAQALISVRMAIEQKFRPGARKSRISWEEISLGMASMGITKTAKQCRDKWETMIKCFKRAEKSGRTKAENAKTCPYFQELDMFYGKLLIDPEKAPKAETETS
ncbi:trihelix transcription factor GT-2-like [Papaver somniferum]|uniref:trihelix transcription factor GT-2-like n=1 Tax=Papaver somniferum TaxID=3469 RepID=UPI000E70537B|nr:trihelix transcription factor GT-2-like [Papaver somniferum]